MYMCYYVDRSLIAQDKFLLRLDFIVSLLLLSKYHTYSEFVFMYILYFVISIYISLPGFRES